MPLAIVQTRARVGMNAPQVTVEVHLSNGLPAFNMVGLPDAAVRESKERVRSAILNAGFDFPQRRITINLAPADLPKDGGRFDLPIAVGILAASEQIALASVEPFEFIGELALSGELRPVEGVLTASIAATAAKLGLFVPQRNAAEAALPASSQIYPCDHLLQVCSRLKNPALLSPHPRCMDVENDLWSRYPDLADVKGQHLARRALEVAAAGKHNLLMMGPPGAGKSMLAARLPGILPPMTEAETMETAAIHSVSQYNPKPLFQRPIRTPHHTASSVALAGGGSNPKPGEISLAHNGVLFLDEFPEFPRKVLEVLREPLETGEIAISRAAQQVVYPANFQLIAALNPCPCGHPKQPPEGCTNPQQCCSKYQSKLSGPLLDRIDMHIQVDALPISDLQKPEHGESSDEVRDRVTCARAIQLQRQGCANHDLNSKQLNAFCQLSDADSGFALQAVNRLGLSARGYHRILKVARTLADLAQAEQISKVHLSEALSYRALFN
ncbi:YifB family Mg chelatase-like AAA ATPase [Ketobacter sp. MCCC 1A13808]|uniref:YifB family Mg chelatase-like AAA ATPase n=1 Tax=Ketobacter sp. MCCC 1A13808 TaxID=2602738 RepID=UPI000F17C90A|nr:YifB family Mg chelatase-like AAA ATPase [Ketobacter sp. MCCC 1A13808]MVF14501.1 YifB family Mg chelatase-like AAA ATPase [Ketobacter sp. MCCC 1A13808]RLP55029.1 MAG: ATP-dependent protease [Ketobacter sp.]